MLEDEIREIVAGSELEDKFNTFIEQRDAAEKFVSMMIEEWRNQGGDIHTLMAYMYTACGQHMERMAAGEPH